VPHLRCQQRGINMFREKFTKKTHSYSCCLGENAEKRLIYARRFS